MVTETSFGGRTEQVGVIIISMMSTVACLIALRRETVWWRAKLCMSTAFHDVLFLRVTVQKKVLTLITPYIIV